MDIEKIKQSAGGLRREVKERTKGSLLAAFGLVVGLAWNEAVKAFIEYWFPLSSNSTMAKFLYALILTIVLAFVAYYLTSDRNENKG